MRKIFLVVLCVAVIGSALGCRSLTGKSAGEVIDDSVITTEINAKIVETKGLHYLKIDVDTFQGHVTLNGTVSSAEDEAKAIEIARSVKGVKSVKSNLRIQP